MKKKERSKMGIVGLQNLGNTCFLNTSLQCISSCWELTNYFLKNHYKKDININNPIGTKGILARAYAHLLKNLWYGEAPVFSPWNFKRAIAAFQPMVIKYFI
jgi:ubiquitin carboxyl-terminal hydrolase 4/11/15